MAVAVLPGDMVKEIQQFQYLPHGASSRFLSPEDGRTSDANTLANAWFGFRFMARFGGALKLNFDLPNYRIDLPNYRIVQGTHFSPGGAHPIDAHFYQKTPKSGATPQEIPDFAEQACFLHTLCAPIWKHIETRQGLTRQALFEC